MKKFLMLLAAVTMLSTGTVQAFPATAGRISVRGLFIRIIGREPSGTSITAAGRLWPWRGRLWEWRH